MMHISPLSKACQTALVFDQEAVIAYRYADLYAAEAAKPQTSRPLTLADICAHREERSYLICWDHGVTAHYRSRQAPHQINPQQIEALYKHARRMKAVQA